MTPQLTAAGYVQTKSKLANLTRRLKELESRSVQPRHFAAVRRSYLRMIQQYTRAVKLYEAKHAAPSTDHSVAHSPVSANKGS